MSSIVVTMTISFQDGFDTSQRNTVAMVCDRNTNLGEIVDWAEQYKNTLGTSDLVIVRPANVACITEGGGDGN